MNEYLDDDSTRSEIIETNQPKAGVPTSQGDVLGILQTPNEGTIAEKMGTHDQDFSLWSIRSRLSEEQGLAMLEMFTEDMALEEGNIDYKKVNWMYASFQTGLNGKARDDMMRMTGAAVDREDKLRAGFFRGFTHRGSPNDRGQSAN